MSLDHPSNVTGHFCDLFVGIHVTHGKAALKRPRVGPDQYTQEDLQVSLLSPRLEGNTLIESVGPAVHARGRYLERSEARLRLELHWDLPNRRVPLYGVALH